MPASQLENLLIKVRVGFEIAICEQLLALLVNKILLSLVYHLNEVKQK